MLRKKMGNKRGFTLVELMIAVVIMGILATLAVFGVMAYIRSVKTSEARHQLGFITNGQVVQFAKAAGAAPAALGTSGTSATHALCPATSASVPTTPPAGVTYQSNDASWTDAAWTCLGYSIDGQQRYAYSMPTSNSTPTNSTDAAFTAQAQGDLDGDSVSSSFTLQGVGTGATGRVRMGEIFETQPNE